MSNRDVLKKEFKEQSDALKKAKTIVLYGNSIVACIMKIAIKELEFEARCEIFDKGRFINEIDISNENVVVILCSSRLSTRKSMKSDACKYFPNSIIFDFYASYYSWITNVVKRKCDYEIFAETLILARMDKCIPNIDSINTLYCNLRCKECSNGIQYRKNKRIINVDSQIKHLEKLTNLLPISQCNFQGGEVFTDVNFASFVEKHSYNPRIGIFTIATNGTLLAKDEVFKIIKATGCMIRISDYGIISKKKDEIIAKCAEFDIPCFTFPMAETWKKFGEYKKRNRTEEENKKACTSCCFGTHDLMFVDDKIYCCLRTLFASAIGEDTEEMRANTLDLDSNITLEQLQNFVDGKNLWRMCDYCDSPMEDVEPAEQL